MQSAIILAGGKSTRMGMNKALVNILGKSLLSWSVDYLSKLVDDLIVVARNDNDAKLYEKILSEKILSEKILSEKILSEKILSEKIRIVIDDSHLEGPLVGIISGFKVAKSDYCYVHPLDSPIIKKEVIEYLFRQAKNFDGAVWKIHDNVIEPLHAVYQVSSVLKISKRILETGDTSAKILSKKIRLNYLCIDALRSLDEELASLFNINKPDDVKFAEKCLKDRQHV